VILAWKITGCTLGPSQPNDVKECRCSWGNSSLLASEVAEVEPRSVTVAHSCHCSSRKSSFAICQEPKFVPKSVRHVICPREGNLIERKLVLSTEEEEQLKDEEAGFLHVISA